MENGEAEGKIEVSLIVARTSGIMTTYRISRIASSSAEFFARCGRLADVVRI